MVSLELLLFGVIAMTSCPCRAAEKSVIVKSIDIRYVGTKSLSEQRILSKLSTKVGSALSSVQIDEDIKSLHASGEVKNVKILAEDTSGGAALIVVVECAPLYGGVKFDGNSVYSDNRLAKTLEISTGRPIDELAIRTARQEILTLYRKKGYSEAEINYQISSANRRGYARVDFQIVERKPTVLRRISFKGNTRISAEDLKGVMKQKERGIRNLVGGGGRTDADSIAEDIAAIEQHYRNSGYFDARVVDVNKVPVDKKFNDLVISIQEGKVYTISDISIDGITDPGLKKEIAAYLKTKAGQPFNSDALQADVEMIMNQYRSRGFLDAQVVPRIEEP